MVKICVETERITIAHSKQISGFGALHLCPIYLYAQTSDIRWTFCAIVSNNKTIGGDKDAI